jgi:hypothetical protein
MHPDTIASTRKFIEAQMRSNFTSLRVRLAAQQEQEAVDLTLHKSGQALAEKYADMILSDLGLVTKNTLSLKRA